MSHLNIGSKYPPHTLTYISAIVVCACSVPEYNIPSVANEGGQIATASGGSTNNATAGSTSKSVGGASAIAGATNSGGNAGALTSGGNNNSGGLQSSGGLSDNAGTGALGGTSSLNATGGATGTGGSSSSGIGGALVTGGAVATGGTTTVPGTGGSPSTGGSNDAGGAQSTGGIVNTGGAPVTGGMPGTGGVTSTGGALVTGGAPTTGGAISTGGVVTTGGMPSTGGAPTGGAPTGGAPATGGAPSTGGAVSTGGSSSTCPAGFVFCDNFEQDMPGGAATGWTAGAGTWSVITDSTETTSDQLVYSNTNPISASSQAGTSNYANSTIEARIRVISFSSNSSSNAAGIFLRSNGTNDYDLSLGGNGMIYLRRQPTSSTVHTCTSGTSSANSGVTVTTTGCSTANLCTPGWFKLKLVVAGTVAGGITITGYVDPTGSSGYTQVLQCVQNPGTQFMIDTGTAGVFAKGSAPAEYDDVLISTP